MFVLHLALTLEHRVWFHVFSDEEELGLSGASDRPAGSAGNVRREGVTDDVEMHFSYRFGPSRGGADVGYVLSRRLGIALVRLPYRQRGVVGVCGFSELQLQRDVDTFAQCPRYEFIENETI
ncbi:hypothetical protein NJBCHELONAE_15100 [Mycobacteroides chelonae]|nr:hypothetical protein NJBCHELONAE_15100 [Mycobacteroides chelonae]